jgi:hypothetical protein
MGWVRFCKCKVGDLAFPEDNLFIVAYLQIQHQSPTVSDDLQPSGDDNHIIITVSC